MYVFLTVAPLTASAAFDAALQGQSATSSAWIDGNIMGWGELDYIPCRVYLEGGPVTGKTIVVDFDHHRNMIPGIQNLTGFTPSTNVVITSPPVLSAPLNSGTWSYTFTINLTDRNPGFVEFRARLSAGAHLNVGSSLALHGSPSLGSLQIFKPGPGAGTPDLAVFKTGPSNAAPDTVLTYVLSYTNKGSATDPAFGVQLTDILPNYVTYVPNSASPGGTLLGNTLTWDLGNLQLQSSGTVTYQARVNTEVSYGQLFYNFAQILSAENDANYLDNSNSVRTVVLFNRAPVANDDTYNLSEDSMLTVPATGVLGNDSDADGNAITAILLTSPAHGTLTLNADGSFIYTPNANFNGPDSFTYKANDGLLDSSAATVTINVSPVNDPPVANSDAYATDEDTPLAMPAPGVLGNDTDVEGDPLTAVLVSGPAHGTLTLNADGSFLYSPAAQYNGPDGFTYRAKDGGANSGVTSVAIMVNPVNDAPVANDDAFSVNEDETLSISPSGILANDTDVDGDSLSAILVAGPSHGTLSLNPNGSFTYTPSLNYNGPDAFSYKANDGHLNSGVATVAITVRPVNDPPVANDDVYTVPEDEVLTISSPGVLSNDTDVDGDSLMARLVAGPSHGTLSLSPNGAFVYTPAPNYNGSDSFTYIANHGSSDSVAATVSITVTPVNDLPVAGNDSYTLNEDATLTVLPASGVLANDTDIDSDVLTAVLIAGPSHGKLTLSTDGSFSYIPNANYNGSDSFSYKANDGLADSAAATVSLAILPVNDAPLASNDAYTTSEDTPLNISVPGVLINDSDLDGDPLTAILVMPPGHGALTLNPNGSFNYTPNSNYNGPDSFIYKANDGTADSATATVSITILSINDPPVANNNAYSTDEDTVLIIPAPGILGNDTDVDGDSLTAVLVSGPSHGSVSLNADGSFSYTPNLNYNGADSFTYKANDGLTDSPVATVSITVNPLNDPPIANDDSFTMDEDTILTMPAPGVLINDTDVDSTLLIAVLVSAPARGTLTLSTNGSFLYQPNTNYHGADTFTYKVTDGAAESSVATVTIIVNPINDAPIAANDAYSINEDTVLTVAATSGVLANDTDVETNTLTAILMSAPVHGTLSLNADGSFRYEPAANYYGTDTFTYKANDGIADSAVATVTINVNPTNDAPVAANDSYSVNEDTLLSVAATSGVLANDSDVETNALSALLVSGPNHGTLTLNADGSFSYRPNADYYGNDSFTYMANDGIANSAVATVMITIAPVNDAPVAANDSYSVNEDTLLDVSAINGVLSNDTDVETNTLSALLITEPTHGTLTLNANGSFRYRPLPNYYGSDSFNYKASDGSADSGVATVTINVNPVNDAPVAADDAYSVNEDTLLEVSAINGVLANDTDVETNTLSAIVVSEPAHGTLTLNGNGSFNYHPAANYYGTDTFTYKANDGTADSALAMVTITINPVNDAPLAIDDVYAVNESALLQVPATDGVLSNDTDVETNSLTAILVSGPAHGVLILQADGSFSYEPALKYYGSDSFTYKANDGAADSPVASVLITINPINDAPVTANDAYTVDEDNLLAVPASTGLLANDSDVETNILSAMLVSGTAHGTVTLKADGSFTYSPIANYNGPDSFTYKVNDGIADSGMATVTITINPVNDAPSFVKGPNQLVQKNASSQTVLNWVTSISPGPPDEAGQTLTFLLTTDNSALFAVQPTISAEGTLSYTPAPGAFGRATITVLLKDNGGTANGGIDTSAPQTFTITINNPPVVNITMPANGAFFFAPANISIVAEASDADGTITNVAIFQGTNHLADVPDAPYFTIWTNVPTGQYPFRAVATDDTGATGASAPISVTVLERPPLLIISPMQFNRQSGLFEETVRVSNPTAYPYDAVRVLITGLRSVARVQNASGYTNGVPYVQSNIPVLAGGYVDLMIEIYDPQRQMPNPTLLAEFVSASPPPNPNGTYQHVSRILRLSNGTFLIEFSSLANRVYCVQYSKNLIDWATVASTVTGNGTRIQWIDNGPPKTEPHPAIESHRFYRVLMLP